MTARPEYWRPTSASRRTGAAPDPESPTLRERFRRKVDTNGPLHPRLGTNCHIWTAAKNAFGYGQFFTGWNGRKAMPAHVVAWALANGRDAIPDDGTNICHACDNPSCVRVDHLYLATHAERMRHKVERGRSAHCGDRSKFGPKTPATGARHGSRTHPARLARGERNGDVTLTEGQVLAIREATGRTQADLARQFGVTQVEIGNIRRGAAWTHVGGSRSHVGKGNGPRTAPPKARLSPEATHAAVLGMMPPEDRVGATKRRPERQGWAYGAVARLAKRLGVTPGMVLTACRAGITEDMLGRWRTILSSVGTDVIVSSPGETPCTKTP